MIHIRPHMCLSVFIPYVQSDFSLLRFPNSMHKWTWGGPPPKCPHVIAYMQRWRAFASQVNGIVDDHPRNLATIARKDHHKSKIN